MTSAEFRAALDTLGLSQAEAARRWQVTVRSVTNWADPRGIYPPPRVVALLLDAWQRLGGPPDTQ